MKILAKLARRNNGNELPRRGEYVEMDLFDTERNPLEFPAASSGGGWAQHDYNQGLPSPIHAANITPGWGNSIVGPIELVVEEPSFAIGFVAGRFNLISGPGDGENIKQISVKMEVYHPTLDAHLSIAAAQYLEAEGPGNIIGAYNLAVLMPGTYSVHVWTWTSIVSGGPVEVDLIDLSATLALLAAPPPTGAGGGGWEGSGV